MGGGSIWLRHPVPKFNREAVERSAPVVNRHRPLFGDPLQGHVIELEDRFLMGKHPAILADFTQGPVDRSLQKNVNELEFPSRLLSCSLDFAIQPRTGMCPVTLGRAH